LGRRGVGRVAEEVRRVSSDTRRLERDGVLRAISITVDGPPPSGHGSGDDRDGGDGHPSPTTALREAMRDALAGRAGFIETPVSLEIRYTRGRSVADAASLIAGVVATLRRKGGPGDREHDVWAFDDDRNIRELHYTEELGDADRYVVALTALRKG